MKKRIYLDYNATAPLRPEALSVMQEIMEQPLNASAVHNYGQQGRKYVEEARRHVAALVQIDPAQIIFNSGATEGNNTVLKHFVHERILISAIEHDSVLKSLPGLTQIPVTEDSIIDLNALEDLLKAAPTALVSVMWANNETGIIQPIEEISNLAHKHGALFHCDAVQAAGRIPVSMTGIDFLTLSSHKLGGPQGVGALVLGLCGQTPTLLEGGGQEKSARAGTENVAGIAGFGKAIECLNQNHHAELQQTIEARLKSIVPDIIIYGEKQARLPNTTLFSIPGTRSESLLMAFDLEGIALSNGSACSSGSVQPSHVLKAMGRSDEEARAAIRVSTGWATTQEDIEIFYEKFHNIMKRVI